MPLTPTGKEILATMEAEYGTKKGESVFYASQNAGKIKGTHRSPAENVQAFDETALGETPPRVGIVTGHPERDVLPSATGTPPGLIKTDGLENPRADLTQMGPTRNANPGAGVKVWPAIQSYNGETV